MGVIAVADRRRYGHRQAAEHAILERDRSSFLADGKEAASYVTVYQVTASGELAR